MNEDEAAGRSDDHDPKQNEQRNEFIIPPDTYVYTPNTHHHFFCRMAATTVAVGAQHVRLFGNGGGSTSPRQGAHD